MKAKKLLAMILSLTMILGLCTVGAKAADAPAAGRTLTLTVAEAGSATASTTFSIVASDSAEYGNADLKTVINEYAHDGDTIQLPAGTLYLYVSGGDPIRPHDTVTVKGAGEGSTILEYHSQNDTNGRSITVQPGAKATFEDMTYTASAQPSGAFYVKHATLTLRNMTITGFTGAAVFVNAIDEAYNELNDADNTSKTLADADVYTSVAYAYNVNTSGNSSAADFHVYPASQSIDTLHADATQITKGFFYYDTECTFGETPSFKSTNGDTANNVKLGHKNAIANKIDAEGNVIESTDLLPGDTCENEFISHAVYKDNLYGTGTRTYLPPLVQDGDKYFLTAQDAIDAAQDGDTITLLEDVEITAPLSVEKNLTIEGDGHTITAQTGANRMLWIDASDVTLTLNSIVFDGNDISQRGVQVNPNMNGVTLNINDCVIDNITYYGINICSDVSDLTLNIDGSDISAWGALNLWGEGYHVTVTNTKLTGHNDKGYNADGWNDFGTVILEGDTTGETDLHSEKCTVVLENCDIFASTTSQGNKQWAILFNNPSAYNTVMIKGDSNVVYGEENTSLVYNSSDTNALIITGGTFSSDPNQYVAEGYIGNKIADNKYVVGPIVKVEDTEESATVTDEASGVSITFDTDSNNELTAADALLGENSSLALVVEPKETDSYEELFSGTEATIEDIIDITVKKTTVTKDENGVVQSTVTEEVPITNVTSTVSYYYPNYDSSKVYKVYYFPTTGDPEDMNATYNPATKSFEFVINHNSEYGIVSTSITETNKAAKIDVAFKPTAEANVYDIVLLADSGKYIHGFTSADLTFQLDVEDGQATYVIDPVAGMTTLNDSKAASNRYEFNMDGIHYDRANGSNIKIGTVTFLGYGKIDFKVTNDTTNIVNTTKLNDSIVEKNTVAGGVLKINNAAATSDATPTALIDNLLLSPVSKSLTVNVMFPNDAANQVKAYQDMTMTISGGDLYEDIVINLGSDPTFTGKDFLNQDLAADAITVAYNDGGVYASGTCNQYVVSIPATLHKNIRYTVTVSGAGYRSARYSLNMSGDKTLTFWNNVMDDDTVIETGNDATTAKVTYLAGDIVKDEQINIYDLSAVVSYFGTTGLTADNLPEYAKYDLNRDGAIDSIDVAYVLVSWGY